MSSSSIVVFGAGGRAGRHTVAEAVARGHRVTAVVRDPAGYTDLAGAGVTIVAGDVTRADSVAEVAAGHDAVISAAGRLDMPSDEFYVSAAHALLDGLARAGVGRLVLIGIGSTLETAPGVAVHDAPVSRRRPEPSRSATPRNSTRSEPPRRTSTGSSSPRRR